MSFAHITFATQHVEETASFLETTLGYKRNASPANSPVPVIWLNIGRGQEFHILYVENFHVSEFEAEFGRHTAVFHPLEDFPALKERLTQAGAELSDPLRPSVHARFFFREPINGYVFEVIDKSRESAA